MESEIRTRLTALADELKKIFEKNLLRDPSQTHESAKRVHEIRDEIHSYGCEVSWTAEINLQNPDQVFVEVTLWIPKPIMTPEQQKIYDEWFAKVNTPEQNPDK